MKKAVRKPARKAATKRPSRAAATPSTTPRPLTARAMQAAGQQLQRGIRMQAEATDRLVALRSRSVNLPALNREARAAGTLRVLIEGDSWFNIPVANDRAGYTEGYGVASELRRLRPMQIVNIAHWGDTAEGMLTAHVSDELIRTLTGANPPFDVLMFSGGGNDVLAKLGGRAEDGPLYRILKPYADGATARELVDADVLDAKLTIVLNAYQELVALRDQYSPTTRLYLHAYDFPQPRLVTRPCSGGPWMHPVLVARGIRDAQLQIDVIAVILRALAGRLRQLASSQRLVRFIETQGTLQTLADWFDEIHPNTRGFIKIAQKYSTAFAEDFPQ